MERCKRMQFIDQKLYNFPSNANYFKIKLFGIPSRLMRLNWKMFDFTLYYHRRVLYNLYNKILKRSHYYRLSRYNCNVHNILYRLQYSYLLIVLYCRHIWNCNIAATIYYYINVHNRKILTE